MYPRAASSLNSVNLVGTGFTVLQSLLVGTPVESPSLGPSFREVPCAQILSGVRSPTSFMTTPIQGVNRVGSRPNQDAIS